MRTFAKALALIAVVAAVVSVADPSSRPTVGRMAVFAVAVAAAGTLTSRLSHGEPGRSSPFEPPVPGPPPPAVPTELAELVASLRAVGAGRRVDGQLRAALHAVAESRLTRHGLDLDRPEHAGEVRARLGTPLLAALDTRTPPDDPEDLVTPLEAL